MTVLAVCHGEKPFRRVGGDRQEYRHTRVCPPSKFLPKYSQMSDRKYKQSLVSLAEHLIKELEEYTNQSGSLDLDGNELARISQIIAILESLGIGVDIGVHMP